MEVAKQSNVRAGPRTDYDILGTLAPGVGVRVTGKVKDRDWFRVDLREDGGSAFIYAPLLKEIEVGAPVEPFGPNWIITTNQPCQLWNSEPKSGETVTWTGDCVGGKASGVGRSGGKAATVKRLLKAVCGLERCTGTGPTPQPRVAGTRVNGAIARGII